MGYNVMTARLRGGGSSWSPTERDDRTDDDDRTHDDDRTDNDDEADDDDEADVEIPNPMEAYLSTLLSQGGKSVAVLNFLGSLCPITLGHVQSVVEAHKILTGKATPLTDKAVSYTHLTLPTIYSV